MSNSIKCPSCASNLKYNIEAHSIACVNCGNKYEPDEIPYVKDDIDELDCIVCNNCGAEVIADKFTSATFCAYCGASTMVTSRLEDKFKPNFIIPFEITKEEALKNFEKFAKKVRLRTNDFLNKKTLDKMTPIYVPFWLFDVYASFGWRGTGYVYKGGSRSRSRTADMFNISRSGDSTFTLMPLDGSNRFDDDLMESIEPFDFHNMKDYHPGYISGFYANKYTIPAEKLHTRIKRRVEDYLDEMIQESTKEAHYSKTESGIRGYQIDDPHCTDYALLPVWFLHYSYKGKSYNFAINGQTGEVAGIVPQSSIKKAIAYLVGLLPAILFTIVACIPALSMHATDLAVANIFIYSPLTIPIAIAGLALARYYFRYKGIEKRPGYLEYWRGGKYTEMLDQYISTIDVPPELVDPRFADFIAKWRK